MRIASIPSSLPGWYDPTVPEFVPPKSWDGARVRVRVTVENDPAREIAEARAEAEKKYPGATIVVVPDHQTSTAPDVDITGTDEEVLNNYLSQVNLPAGVTKEQMLHALSQYLPSGALFGVLPLKFKEVEARGVLCFEHVAWDLDQKGVTLISGINHDWDVASSNGAGKSSIVSLPWVALFGRTFKGQTHDGWARKDSTKEAVVRQTVELSTGQMMVVERGRRPSRLRAWIGSREVTMGKPELTQRKIEEATNLTWEVLTNSVYLGQREIGSVFGTEKERKELFSRLLGLDRFLAAQEALRKVVLRKQSVAARTEMEEGEIVALGEEVRRSLKEIDAALKAAPATTANDAKKGQYRVRDAQQREKELRAEIEALEKEMGENQSAFERLLFSQQDAEARAEALSAQLKKCEEIGTAECSLCGSVVTKRHLASHTKRIKRDIEAQEEIAEEKTVAMQRNRTVRRGLAEALRAKRDSVTDLRKKYDEAVREAAVLEEQAAARERLLKLREAKSRRAEDFAKAELLAAKAREACVAEVEFAKACALVVGRDGLPAHLCALVSPRLNKAAAFYSDLFTSGEIGVRFEMVGGDIDVAVDNAHGGGAVKDQSAGEMRMAAIVAALSFRDALVPHNVLILDEPSEGLDPANAEAFARGLNKVAERFGHVVVISHHERLLGVLEPDRHLVVEKRGGVSTVREV